MVLGAWVLPGLLVLIEKNSGSISGAFINSTPPLNVDAHLSVCITL